MGTATEMVFLSMPSYQCNCMYHCAVLIASLTLFHCVLTLITLKENFYPRFTYEEMETTATEKFVQVRMI